MIVRHSAAGPLILSVGFAALLMGCASTPLGPSVQAMPGPGKTFDAFQSDNNSCKAFASDQVRGQADAANQRAAGTVALTTVLGAGLGAAVGGSVGDAANGAAIGAAGGAATGSVYGAGNAANDQAMIQQQYDNAFSQCMYAKGEQVPGFAPVVAAAPAGPAPDPLVRSSQLELIRLGFLHGSADGYMGPRTRAAIVAYEQSHALPTDGSPSPGLLARLQSTPTGAAATATASAPSTSSWVAPTGSANAASPAAAPSGWVAPTGSANAAAPSAASSGWVAPTGSTPTATPASATAPASSGWVAPTKQ
jgi:hypothetical protein